MYDQNGEFIYKHAHTMSDHPDAEFLEDTECDDEAWAQEFYWTPDQATMLSFGRSPEKLPFDKYMDEMEGSSEFVDYCFNLRDLILEAQAEGMLPKKPVIPALLFVQWAEGNRYPFPPGLADKVEAAFAAVTNVRKEPNQPLGSAVKHAESNQHDDTADVDAQGVSARPYNSVSNPGQADDPKYVASPPGKVRIANDAPQTRFDPRPINSCLKIIYALAWRHYGLGADVQSKTAIAASIQATVRDLAVVPDVK